MRQSDDTEDEPESPKKKKTNSGASNENGAKGKFWSPADDALLLELADNPKNRTIQGVIWGKVAVYFPGRGKSAVSKHYQKLKSKRGKDEPKPIGGAGVAQPIPPEQMNESDTARGDVDDEQEEEEQQQEEQQQDEEGVIEEDEEALQRRRPARRPTLPDSDEEDDGTLARYM